MIATGEVIANPSDNYKFMIILSPAKSLFRRSKSIDHFSRAANGGIGLQLQIMPHNFIQLSKCSRFPTSNLD
jgi:hypothetical protein